jgi:hypothetical protein
MNEAMTGDPAIPFEILRNQLEQYCFGNRSLRILQCYQEFLGLQFWSQQISYVHEFARLELCLEISIGSLERAFNCLLAAVKRSLRNGLEPPKSRDRHTALADDAETDILAWIEHQV